MTVLFLVTGMTWHFSRLNVPICFPIYHVCEDLSGEQLCLS